MSLDLKDIIHSAFKNQAFFSTSELKVVLQKAFPEAADKTLSWKIYQLKEEGFFHQMGRGAYTFESRPAYMPDISMKTKRTYNKIKSYCTDFKPVVWDTVMLSIISGEVVTKHFVFVAIPKEKLESTFNQLLDFSKKIFLDPEEEVIRRYLLPQDDAVVLLPLLSETPTIKLGDFMSLSIEALLVNSWVMSENYLNPIGISIESLFRAAFDQFNVNESKLLRYAARRDKRVEIEKIVKKSYII